MSLLATLAPMLGGPLAALLRFAPEVLKYMDKGGERKHELAMLTKQAELDRLHAEQGRLLAQAQGAAAVSAIEAEAFKLAVEASGRPTGIPVVDAINALVRPLLTLYWCVGLYTAVMISKWTVLQKGGLSADAALLALWGPWEQALVAGMIGFWFADRAIAKGHTVVK